MQFLIIRSILSKGLNHFVDIFLRVSLPNLFQRTEVTAFKQLDYLWRSFGRRALRP